MWYHNWFSERLQFVKSTVELIVGPLLSTYQLFNIFRESCNWSPEMDVWDIRTSFHRCVKTITRVRDSKPDLLCIFFFKKNYVRLQKSKTEVKLSERVEERALTCSKKSWEVRNNHRCNAFISLFLQGHHYTWILYGNNYLKNFLWSWYLQLSLFLEWFPLIQLQVMDWLIKVRLQKTNWRLEWSQSIKFHINS